MKKPSEYSSGRFAPPSQMVNGNPIYPGYPIAVRLVQFPIQPSSVYLPSILPHYQQYGQSLPVQQYGQSPNHPSAVPPPSNPQFFEVCAAPPQTKPVTERTSHALPIIDPSTKKPISLEKEHNTVSTLHQNEPPNFEPTHSSGFETQEGSGESVEDSPPLENELKKTAVNLNDTIESEHLGEEFSFGNDEVPSITASIRQIPSNLEQKLGFDDEIVHHSNIKATILPTKQESHSSLPDTFRRDTSQKHNRELYSQSPPFRHNYRPQQHFQSNIRPNFHPKKFDQNNNVVDHRQYQNKHNFKYNPSQHNNRQQQNQQKYFMQNSENNLQRSNYENDFYAMRLPFKNFQQKNYNTSNSQSQKVDQECTAHPIKDLNQNYIIDGNEKIMELKDLKLQQTVDENNNNQIEEFMTGESLESTTENTDGSLNSSRRYTTKELTGLRKSPLVLSKPPTERDKLLDSNLDSSVWKILFDRNNHNNHRQDYDSNDCHNMSLPNNKNSNLRRTNSNMRYDNNHNQLTRSKSGSEKQLIKLNLSLKDDVKLNTAENAWKPGHMQVPEEMSDEERQLQSLIKNFRSLLNKITEENFEYLVQEVNDKRRYVIDSSEKLNAVVDLLFEKSVSEPGYAATYAKLCRALSAVHVFNVEAHCKKTKNPWKTHLVSRCQYEFERSSEDELAFRDIQEKIKNATDSEEIENLENVYFKLRQRANGTFKFIGELYKIDLLTAGIMKKCIEALLCSVTEENIERLCKLFTTVGEKLEGQLKGGDHMDVYMRKLDKLKGSSVITTSRIRFEIMNVIDLRATNWKQRENAREAKPQKLQELQEEEEKRKRIQHQQLIEYNERQHRSHHNNNLGRQKSQRTIDSEGFRMSVSKQIDMNKIQIPRKNDNDVKLGPPVNFYQNFNKPMSQMAPPPTSISNPFGNLLTDCDEPEQLPIIHHTRSGTSNKNNRKDKDSNNNKNGKKGSHSNGKKDNQTKKRTPSPEIKAEQSIDFEDDFFMIDLTGREDEDMRLLMEKMQQHLKGKINFDMLLSDLKKIKITKNVLGYIYNDLFDKRSSVRKELIELIGEICRKGFITKTINVEALKLAIKAIPSIICDVPFAFQYFSEYCVYFIETGLLTLKDAENICENQQHIFEKIVIESKKISTSNVEEEVSKPESSGESKELEDSEVCEQTEQNDSSNTKPERCLKSIMEFIQFKLKKKHKDNNFLEEIYKGIEKEDCQSASNFIKDLTITLLKASCEKGKKKAKKSVDLSKLFPVFIRYINNDKSSQIDCINAIQEFVFSNPENNDYNLYKLFDLFYDNDVISVEAFKFWKEQQPISPKKREAIKQTANFFTKLEEIDLSSDFNCTSSTIKD